MKDFSTVSGPARQRPDASWPPGPSPLAFPNDRVDVWSVRLDRAVTAGSETAILSPDEIMRAGRFHFEKDRIRFTRCRSVLRRLLAGYLAIPASAIRFEYLSSGKPQLAGGQNPRALQFNLSHSTDRALIAVGSEHRLGIDVERIRDDVHTISMTERFFSPRECAGLQALPDGLRVRGFFACWTRKEAFLKATGTGLSFPLADFSVTTHPDLDPEIEDIEGNTAAGKQWFLADLSIAEGYRATVAVERSHSRLETYSWN